MSCGEPHDIDCSEVLDRIYVFIDNELTEGPLTHAQIRAHLEECGPCLRKYDLERLVKSLVARSCANDRASAELRAKVLGRIHRVQIQITQTKDG